MGVNQSLIPPRTNGELRPRSGRRRKRGQKHCEEDEQSSAVEGPVDGDSEAGEQLRPRLRGTGSQKGREEAH